jgi:hypothetical protein
MAMEQDDSRRGFIKKALYVVPAVVSLNLALVEARAGSGTGIRPNTRDAGRALDPTRPERDVNR